MMSLISCLERFNKDQAMCVDEINHFNRCFVKFRETQAIDKEKKAKGILPLGQNVKLTGDQMTQYLHKFPLSSRTKQTYFHPEFKPKLKS